MTASPPPLVSLSVDPRARLVLFDIADDPAYVAMEIQVFDDPAQGRGALVLLARHDGRVEVHCQPQLRIERRPFSIGRGIEAWREAVIDPARVEVMPDGIVVDAGLEDAQGRRIEVQIDDRDGTPRQHATLLAPVSSGVEHPEQLLVVLLREFDLVRTGGTAPRLVIGGQARTITPFPGPAWLHHRRFIRYSGAPVIVTVNPAHEGPVDAASLGPIDHITAGEAPTTARLRFEPPVPDLQALVDGATAAGSWWLDVVDEPGLIAGTWTASKAGDDGRLAMAVTQPWRPRGLPLSLRLVTSVARVFRQWPTTYRWQADVDLSPTPPSVCAGWMRVTGPDRENAYGIQRLAARRLVVPLALGLAGMAVVLWAMGRRRVSDPARILSRGPRGSAAARRGRAGRRPSRG